MRRLIVTLSVVTLLAVGCAGSDEPGFDLATQDLTRDGLRDADLADVDLTTTSWGDVDWSAVHVESLVIALGLSIDDRGARPGLDELIDSYGGWLGTDPELGTAEEDVVFWMMSTTLDALARDLDAEAYDAFRADSDGWPDLVADGTTQFQERMRGLVSKSLHLRQAMMIETGG